MRGAACAAVVCSLLLVAACDSGRELSISHPRLLKGEVEAANVAGLRASMPAHVDFVSNRDGFVATEGGTILATGDSGRTWARHGSVPRLVGFDFVSRRRGFALTQRNVLLATGDGGRSWFRVHRFPPSRYGDYPALSFSDHRNGWVLAASAYRTRDGGRTWITASLPCGGYGGLVGPSFPDDQRGYLVCGSQPSAGSQPKTLYVTADGGESWTLRSSTTVGVAQRAPGLMPLGGYAQEISFDRRGIGYMLEARGGLLRSDTGGLTWKGVYYSDVVNDFSAPSTRRIFAIFRSALLRSDDGGRRWRRVLPEGFADPGSPVFFTERKAIAFGVEEPLGTPQTVLSTRDGGRTWSLRGQVPLHGLVEQTFRFGETVLATDSRRLVRSDDEGRTWTRISGLPGGVEGWFSFVSPQVGFLAGGRRLFRTEDGGAHWKVVADKTRELHGVVFVSEHDGFVVDYGPPPPDDGRKHAGPPPRLMHSADGGKTWQELSTPLQNITAVTVLDTEHWWIFANSACRLGRPCRSGRILRTSDGGDHWDLIRLQHALGVLNGNFVSPEVGFAGSPWNGYYRTDDGGVTWRAVYPR